MNISRLNILLWIASIALAAGFSGPQHDDCIALIREIYQKINQQGAKAGNKTFYCKMATKTVYEESMPVKESFATTEIITGQSQSRFICESFTFYQDDTESFMVLPDEKLIYRTDADRKNMRQSRERRLLIFQDTLLKLGQVQACAAVANKDANYDHIIILTFDPEVKKHFNIDKIVYYLSAKQKEIKKIVVTYFQSWQNITEVTYDIVETSYNYKAAGMHKPVKARFLNAKGQLLQPYQDYEIIDVRTQKNK